ncbi:hypothetical protein CTAYLR_008605 [Chrysophaeum taylorii]|uniref:Uncharacterized protein n=1 Tax=Chrysophaeum taylorii TaxID=2483200 RepID=A0AAD7XMW9_9STRA|nr:hypothetical protein CTAYLR_008605 [Chrysophaeum taylorii]
MQAHERTIQSFCVAKLRRWQWQATRSLLKDLRIAIANEDTDQLDALMPRAKATLPPKHPALEAAETKVTTLRADVQACGAVTCAVNTRSIMAIKAALEPYTRAPPRSKSLRLEVMRARAAIAYLDVEARLLANARDQLAAGESATHVLDELRIATDDAGPAAPAMDDAGKAQHDKLTRKSHALDDVRGALEQRHDDSSDATLSAARASLEAAVALATSLGVDTAPRGMFGSACIVLECLQGPANTDEHAVDSDVIRALLDRASSISQPWPLARWCREVADVVGDLAHEDMHLADNIARAHALGLHEEIEPILAKALERNNLLAKLNELLAALEVELKLKQHKRKSLAKLVASADKEFHTNASIDHQQLPVTLERARAVLDLDEAVARAESTPGALDGDDEACTIGDHRLWEAARSQWQEIAASLRTSAEAVTALPNLREVLPGVYREARNAGQDAAELIDRHDALLALDDAAASENENTLETAIRKANRIGLAESPFLKKARLELRLLRACQAFDAKNALGSTQAGMVVSFDEHAYDDVEKLVAMLGGIKDTKESPAVNFARRQVLDVPEFKKWRVAKRVIDEAVRLGPDCFDLKSDNRWDNAVSDLSESLQERAFEVESALADATTNFLEHKKIEDARSIILIWRTRATTLKSIVDLARRLSRWKDVAEESTRIGGSIIAAILFRVRGGHEVRVTDYEPMLQALEHLLDAEQTAVAEPAHAYVLSLRHFVKAVVSLLAEAVANAELGPKQEVLGEAVATCEKHAPWTLSSAEPSRESQSSSSMSSVFAVVAREACEAASNIKTCRLQLTSECESLRLVPGGSSNLHVPDAIARAAASLSYATSVGVPKTTAEYVSMEAELARLRHCKDTTHVRRSDDSCLVVEEETAGPLEEEESWECEHFKEAPKLDELIRAKRELEACLSCARSEDVDLRRVQAAFADATRLSISMSQEWKVSALRSLTFAKRRADLEVAAMDAIEHKDLDALRDVINTAVDLDILAPNIYSDDKRDVRPVVDNTKTTTADKWKGWPFVARFLRDLELQEAELAKAGEPPLSETRTHTLRVPGLDGSLRITLTSTVAGRSESLTLVAGSETVRSTAMRISLRFSLSKTGRLKREVWRSQGPVDAFIRDFLGALRLEDSRRSWSEAMTLLCVPELAAFYENPRGFEQRNGRRVSPSSAAARDSRERRLFELEVSFSALLDDLTRTPTITTASGR